MNDMTDVKPPSESIIASFIDGNFGDAAIAKVREALNAPISRGEMLDALAEQASIDIQIGQALLAIAGGNRQEILATLDPLMKTLSNLPTKNSQRQWAVMASGLLPDSTAEGAPDEQ